MTFFAHSTCKLDQSDWQTLESHLTTVGGLAAEKAQVFGASEYGRVAGLLHDIGKYTEAFQERLTGAGTKVDHSTWGARISCERYGPVGKLIAYGIAGHHAGLANGRDTNRRRCLADRLKLELPTLSLDWQQEIALPMPAALQPPEDFKPRKDRSQFQLAFLARMIFSCLVDADFVDTEAFYKRVQRERNFRDAKSPTLESLRSALDKRLAQFTQNKPVNKLRSDILQHARGGAEAAPGLFSLTVPTGGGKTLTSLAFALDHAIRHGMHRVIYVIPFTSVVEQTAAEFRKAFGELGDLAVLEHHSAFNEDETKALESRQKLKLAMENWDVPIVVTTAVQFFESLFSDRPSACRKVHNIAGSVIILDEAQILPLKLLRPCVAVLDELARNYRSSVVLCTATQPALKQPKFIGGLENVRELARKPQETFREMKRVRVRHLGDVDDAALVQKMATGEQVLCIVNNRRHARALYASIEHLPGACHLSTLMCAKHRSQILASMKMKLAKGEPCRLVATSLVEAGVDIDFQIVLRAEAGLDSIAQAAGRCNREGKRPIENSEVLVFSPDNDQWAPPLVLAQFAQVAREVLRRYPEEPLSLMAVESYFDMLYWQKGGKALDEHDLLDLFESGGLDGMPFETVAAKFRMIDSGQFPVIIPFDDVAQEALRTLAYVERAGGIARRLQSYIVQLPYKGYEALCKAGAIQPVARDKFSEQFMVLANESLYDEHFGLTWDNPVFIEAERSVL